MTKTIIIIFFNVKYIQVKIKYLYVNDVYFEIKLYNSTKMN